MTYSLYLLPFKVPEGLSKDMNRPWGPGLVGPLADAACSREVSFSMPQGPPLYQRLSQSFGYLNKQGYCTDSNAVGSPSGTCHIFPVIFGEMGSGFQDPADGQPMLDTAKWLLNQEEANDGLHNPISGWLWWAWNANSGDHLGLVGADWTGIDWVKVQYMQSIGLIPWYASPQAPVPAPASPPPTEQEPALPPPEASPTPTSAPAVPTPTCPPPAPCICPTPALYTPASEDPPTPSPSPTALPTTPSEESVPAPTPTLSASPDLPSPSSTASASPDSPSPSSDAPATLCGSTGDSGQGVSGWSGGGVASTFPPLVASSLLGNGNPSGGGAAAEGDSAEPFEQGGGISTFGNMLLDSDGKAIELKGVAWSGFDTGTTLGGLEQASQAGPAADFTAGLYQIKALGFNAIKLPFSFKTIFSGSPAALQGDCPATDLLDLQASVTPAGKSGLGWTRPPPAPLGLLVGACNSYVPSTSVLDRFAFFVDAIAHNGLYVVLENSVEEDPTGPQQPQQWVQAWVRLLTRVSRSPATAPRLLLSLLNNGDIYGLKWTQGGGVPAVGDLYLAAMDALWPVNPAAAFLLAGTGQTSLYPSAGAGFATVEDVVRPYRLSSPRSFLKELLLRPYASKVVLGPNLDIGQLQKSQEESKTTWDGLSSSFGYLTQTGFCDAGACTTLPLLLNARGGQLAGQADVAGLLRVASYMEPFCGYPACSAAADGRHTRLGSWSFGDWSPYVPGSLRSADGSTIRWPLIDFLTLLGLKPWFQPPSTALNAWPPTYTGIQTGSAAPLQSVCRARVQARLTGVDPSTGSNVASLVVTVTNTGNVSITPPWTLSIKGQGYSSVLQAFGIGDVSLDSGGMVTGRVTGYWNVLWPLSSSSVSGAVVVLTSGRVQPSQVYVEGNLCELSGASAESDSDGPNLFQAVAVGQLLLAQKMLF
eukprot:jgi/Botrbrau1/4006/Bobra.0016s0017.1